MRRSNVWLNLWGKGMTPCKYNRTFINKISMKVFQSHPPPHTHLAYWAYRYQYSLCASWRFIRCCLESKNLHKLFRFCGESESINALEEIKPSTMVSTKKHI